MIVVQEGNKLFVNGEEIPFEKGMKNNITLDNGKLYVDGREYIDGKWKRTLRAKRFKYARYFRF